jgi:hypothetical protein
LTSHIQNRFLLKNLVNPRLYKLKTTYVASVILMGQVNLQIDDQLEKEFRRVAVERFEAKKGFLKKAVEEAISDWIRKNSRGGRNV